jgi:hypothetical protein
MQTTVIVLGLLLLFLANLLAYYGGAGRFEGFQNTMATTAAPAAATAAAMPPAVVNMAATTTAKKVEGFQIASSLTSAAPVEGSTGALPTATAVIPPMMEVSTTTRGAADAMPGSPAPMKEGFASYFLADGAGAKDAYKPIGAYDGVALPTGNNVSQWRYTAPNEKLMGKPFEPGPDELFMFKNNQCKPECCGASFSCGGGCVCTTPEQRQYIAERGGNRTKPEDSA